MASAYPGIYRAKAQRLDGTRLTANIPQVFGEQAVVITAFVGAAPTTSEMGWVAFHGGRPEYPVWLGVGTGGGGGGGGGGGTVTDTLWVGPDAPTDGSIEMWWDTDDEVDLDPRYLTPATLTPAWTALPGASGWTNYGVGYSTGGYRKIGDIVYLRGLVKKATTPVGAIGTLPSGFRPPNTILCNAWIVVNASAWRGMCRLDIGTDGGIQMHTEVTSLPVGAPTLTSCDHLNLDGISFSVTA